MISWEAKLTASSSAFLAESFSACLDGSFMSIAFSAPQRNFICISGNLQNLNQIIASYGLIADGFGLLLNVEFS
jgi:hypothetical protein